ncbi:hypothetical protein RKD52_003158 [Metabacillus sp. SLBN-84]
MTLPAGLGGGHAFTVGASIVSWKKGDEVIETLNHKT